MADAPSVSALSRHMAERRPATHQPPPSPIRRTRMVLVGGARPLVGTPNQAFIYSVGVLPGSQQPESAPEAGRPSPGLSRTSLCRRPSMIWSVSDPTPAMAEMALTMSSRFNLGPQGRAGPSRRYAVRRPPHPPARCSRRRPCAVTERGITGPGARGTHGAARNSCPGGRHWRGGTSRFAAHDA